MTTSPERNDFFAPISVSAVKLIWPKHNSGLGLYIKLVGLVTVEVPDPFDSKKRVGLLKGGRKRWTDQELADDFGCSLAKLRYEKKILLDEGMLLQRRYRDDYHIAVRYSKKSCRRGKIEDYPWLQEAAQQRETRSRRSSQRSKNQHQPDSKNQQERDSRNHGADSCNHGVDSQSGLDQQNHGHNPADKIIDKSSEERNANPKNPLPKNSSLGEGNKDLRQRAERLTDLITAYCSNTHQVVLAAKNKQQILSGILGHPELLDHHNDVWFFATHEIVGALERQDNDGFARAQANSRLAAALVPAMLGDGSSSAAQRFTEMKRQQLEAERRRKEETERRGRIDEIQAALTKDESQAAAEESDWENVHEGDLSAFVPTNSDAYARLVVQRKRDDAANSKDYGETDRLHREYQRLREMEKERRLADKLVAATAHTETPTYVN